MGDDDVSWTCFARKTWGHKLAFVFCLIMSFICFKQVRLISNKNLEFNIFNGFYSEHLVGTLNDRVTVLQAEMDEENKAGANNGSLKHALKLPCHYEAGDGFFSSESTNLSTSWDPEGKMNWVPYAPLWCKYKDFLSAIMKGPDPITPISLLIIADSVNYQQVRNFCRISKAQGFRQLPQLWEREPSIAARFINTAKTRFTSNTAAAGICTNGRFTLSFFKIFGMLKTCHNNGYQYAEDTRKHVTSVGRIKELLPVDVPSSLVGQFDAILIGSNLWDMSDGCLSSSDSDVTPEYAKAYKEGIRNISAQLARQFPNAKRFWQTSAPISTKYSKENHGRFLARNSPSQIVLNDILRDTIPTIGDDVVVDWWQMMMNWGRPNIDAALPDGRHYPTLPGMAYLNLWLNVLYNDQDMAKFFDPHSVRNVSNK